MISLKSQHAQPPNIWGILGRGPELAAYLRHHHSSNPLVQWVSNVGFGADLSLDTFITALCAISTEVNRGQSALFWLLYKDSNADFLKALLKQPNFAAKCANSDQFLLALSSIAQTERVRGGSGLFLLLNKDSNANFLTALLKQANFASKCANSDAFLLALSSIIQTEHSRGESALFLLLSTNNNVNFLTALAKQPNFITQCANSDQFLLALSSIIQTESLRGESALLGLLGADNNTDFLTALINQPSFITQCANSDAFMLALSSIAQTERASGGSGLFLLLNKNSNANFLNILANQANFAARCANSDAFLLALSSIVQIKRARGGSALFWLLGKNSNVNFLTALVNQANFVTQCANSDQFLLALSSIIQTESLR